MIDTALSVKTSLAKSNYRMLRSRGKSGSTGLHRQADIGKDI